MRKPAEKKNFLYTLFCWVFAAVFAGIWLGTIVNNRTSYYQYQVVPILACGGAALLVLVGAWRLWKRWAFSLPPKKEAALVAGLLAAYFAVQLGFSFLMQVSASPTWDFGIVFSAAREYVLNGTMPGEYFTQFHNNAPMYLFLVAFFKLLHLFGVENFMPFALVLNNLLINASLLALYWALRQLYGAKNALFGLMGSFLFLCFLMYGPILYTDTATMPFPILALAIWLRARQLPWGKGAALRCAVVGLLAAVGAWLKLTVAIMLIAILIDMALGTPRGARWKRAGCALAAFAVLYGALSAVTLHTAWLPEYKKEDAIPYLHWVMMGLYDDGGYNDDAYKLTLQGETYAERLEIDKKEIARKVREMGPAGLAAHAVNKLIFTFGEGMYHAPIKLDLGAVHQNPLQMYFIQGKQHLGRTAYATLAVQLALLAGLCVAAARAARSRAHGATVARVAVFGLMLFLLMWETRSRYLMNFLPVLLLAAFPGTPPKVDEAAQGAVK